MTKLIRPLALTTLLPLFCTQANAAVSFCVNSVASLQNALTTSQSDGDDDYISVVAGTYALNSGLTFVSNEHFNLILVGGFDPTCNDSHAGETLLDGQHAVRPLYVGIDSGNVLIQRMSFIAGFSANAGGGLVAASHSGNVILSYNQFAGNHSTSAAGALYASSDSGAVFLFGNLAYANHGNEVGGFIVKQDVGEGYLLNNTLVANTSDTLADPAGLVATGNAHFRISNNIVWDNPPAGGSDFGTQSAHSRRSNDIGVVAAGAPPDLLVGEQSVAPQFVDCGFLCFSFELARASPLVDAGSDAALVEAGSNFFDLAFRPRTMGPHVDIGAYENEMLFQDGFDP
ncbi:MAG: hypothetical protein ABIQ70_03700 [Dokdonella sp.]